MKPAIQRAYVTTRRELCRMCYTCVRECPAKAIRIAEGQAEVIPERCIACGNCVKVCSQSSKRSISTTHEAEQVLASGFRVAACLAPSFPAEFRDCEPGRLVGMLHALGFNLVAEVAFGADLVAERYRRLLSSGNKKRYIATTCPAIVGYVERYHPDMVGALAPIVSPMIAEVRALRQYYAADLKVVFIGPCIAKKAEAESRHLSDKIDAVITFAELRELFAKHGITADGVQSAKFDPPHPDAGALFPISRGMLQAADIREDLMKGEIVATSGRTNFTEALREFADGHLDARLLEVLCCLGCIMGPGMSNQDPLFRRRSCVSRHVRHEAKNFNRERWEQDMARFADLDLSRKFARNDQRIAAPEEPHIAEIMARMGKLRPENELNCGACGYDTCREHAIAIYKGLAESEMCLPYTIDKLRTTIDELAVSHQELASMQEALMQSEKLASMGQLAAGIAHEVNNPLGVVLMYAHLLLDECESTSKMREDLSIITEQADRCKRIVSGLLHFARQNRVLRQATNLDSLITRSLQAAPKPENVTVTVTHDMEDLGVEVDGDQMIQVLTNLISNAYAAMPDGGNLSLRTYGDADTVYIAVKDTGTGIPPENRKKIFEPFFTTKQMGKGTGLGLAVTYGIIKMHRGGIQLESNHNPAAGPTGSTFTISFARKEGGIG